MLLLNEAQLEGYILQKWIASGMFCAEENLKSPLSQFLELG
jgi:hypothetical protein